MEYSEYRFVDRYDKVKRLTVRCSDGGGTTDRSVSIHAWGSGTAAFFHYSPKEARKMADTLQMVAREISTPIEQLASGVSEDRNLEVLRSEIAQMAQMTHQAYHDSDVSWRECNKGVCQRARSVLGIEF